jgi:hypothetical protein
VQCTGRPFVVGPSGRRVPKPSGHRPHLTIVMRFAAGGAIGEAGLEVAVR